MGYKMKQDESPVTYTLPSGTLGYQPGTFTSGATGATGATGAGGAAGAAGGGMPGLGMAAGALGSVIDEFKPEDPTEKGYMGASIGSKALELGAMGAAAGPIGAAVGVAVGATIGGLTARKEAREARKQKRIQRRAERKGDAISTLAENQAAMGGARTNTTGMSGMSGVFNPQDPYNFSNVAMKKGEIKMKPIKKLGAITGTISPNMSMAQYKNENKFKSIAKKLEEEKIVDVLDSSTGKRTKLTKKDGSYYKAGQLVTLTRNQKEFDKPDLLPKNDKPSKQINK